MRPTTKDTEYIFFLNQVYEQFNLNLGGFREPFLKRRIEKRISDSKCTSYSSYLSLLRKDSKEYMNLLSGLGINVSEFFRDPPMWQVLANTVIPGLFASNVRAPIRNYRLWSCGCATGEEPFSLAILLHEILGGKIRNYRIIIFATDIDGNTMNRPIKSLYHKQRLRNVGPNLLAEYFSAQRNGNYLLREDIKEMVQFSRHDLLSSPLLDEMDLILCRNVFIYFHRQAQEELFLHFHESLRKGGFLGLGKTEGLTGEATKVFRYVDNIERIYQKM